MSQNLILEFLYTLLLAISICSTSTTQEITTTALVTTTIPTTNTSPTTPNTNLTTTEDVLTSIDDAVMKNTSDNELTTGSQTTVNTKMTTTEDGLTSVDDAVLTNTPEEASTTGSDATSIITEVTTTNNVLTTDRTTETVLTTQPIPPGPPVNVSVIDFNSTTIRLSWLEPDSFPEIVRNYVIRFSQVLGNSLYPCNDSTMGTLQTKHVYNATTISLNNLQPWTQYQINVSANSSYGESSEMGIIQRTDESTPEAPYSIEIFNTSAFVVYLIWTQPCQPNGIITGYVLNYTLLAKESNQDCPVDTQPFTVHLDDNSTLHSNISDLLPWTTYTICVSAKTSVGIGEEICINHKTDEYYPEKPTSVQIFDVTSFGLTVNWTEPCNTNGIIIRYHVHFMSELNNTSLDCPNGIHNDTYTTDNNSTFHHNFIDLRPWTKYIVCVVAETTFGTGQESCRNVTTAEDYPNQPRSVEASPISESAIDVKWEAPCPITGEIKNYTIHYVKVFDTAAQPQCPAELPPEENFRNGLSNNIILRGLEYWTSYNICVSANTVVGEGDESCSSTKTEEYIPGKVSNLTTVNVTSSSLYGCWLTPCNPNGVITGYVVNISFLGESQQNTTETTNHCEQLDNLLPYRNYSVSVAAKTSIGVGNYTGVTVETDTDVPFNPDGVRCRSVSSTLIEVTWTEGAYQTGPTNYTATATDVQNNTNIYTCNAKGFGNTACTINNLDEYWNYTIKIKAYTDKGGSETSLPCTNTTMEDAPGYVQNFAVRQYVDLESPRRVKLSWSPPLERERNGIIRNYNITWTPENESEIFKVLPPDRFNLTIEVNSNIEYSFTIQAITIKPGSVNSSTLFINPGIPVKPTENSSSPLIQKSMQTMSNPYRQIAVTLLPLSILCNVSNGKPELWGVIVSSDVEASKETPFSGSRRNYEKMDRYTSTWNSVIKIKPGKSYRATNDSWVPGNCQVTTTKQLIRPEFVVGMDKECIDETGHCNGYLYPGQLYRVKVFWCTSTACTESEYSLPIATAREDEPTNLPTVIGAVAGTVLALVIIASVSLYLWRRQAVCFRRKMQETKDGEDNVGFEPEEMEDTRKNRPVELSEFQNHFDNLSANSNLLFSQQYQDLDKLSPRFSTSDSELQETRMKNRYTNILPFNKTRVKLMPIEDEEGSDYINANYMPGFTSAREYIATQGPLASTINEFWRMIWEQNVSIIVMLTQCVERGRKKCEHYWPKDTQEALFYGDIVIQMESESHLPDYILRTFVLRLGDLARKVRHYYYLLWPDMGTPASTDYMIRFVDTVRRDVRPDMRGPIVVHCSAGVGRTGTFITLDTLFRKIEAGESSIDIFGHVLNLRHSRLNMVQTESQFVYLHECIRDYLQPIYGNSPGFEQNQIYENL